jgi:hypothetical protein
MNQCFLCLKKFVVFYNIHVFFYVQIAKDFCIDYMSQKCMKGERIFQQVHEFLQYFINLNDF